MQKSQKIKLARIISSAVLLITFGLLKPEGQLKPILYMLPYLIAGYDVLLDSLRNILKGKAFDENFLMGVATIGAIILGEYSEAVFVMLFYQIGDMFETTAVRKSRKSISDLIDLNPDYANVIRDGKVIRVTPEEIKIGETILVKPGEKIAADGIVIEGKSSLDTAALTGESLPKDVCEGENVFSGCINLNGLLKIKTTNDFSNSTASKIMELVENSSMNKAHTEKFITRFARYYTPVVVISALLLAVIPPLFTGEWSEYLSRALIFLVVSCPCALVISVPLSFFGGIGSASKNGILIKGSNYIEALAKADTIIFDKTGTLTKGNFTVSTVHPENISKDELIRYAALAESFSNHPISVSLKNACKEDLKNHTVENVREISGKGIEAVIDGSCVYAGNTKLMDTVGVKVPDCPHVGTVVHICVNGAYCGHIEISDEIKKESKEAIDELRNIGIKKTVMLTGDKESVASSVAETLGIDEFYAELMPSDKVSYVEKIMNAKQKKCVIYAGDGINDAPVLSRADVGIAMGGLGSDAAIEAADAVIMDDRIKKISKMIKIAKRTKNIVTQNIVFALGVKFIVLILGAAGFANMWLAIFADVGVSVIAILNSIRTLRA